MNNQPTIEAYKSFYQQAKDFYAAGDIPAAREAFLRAAELANQISVGAKSYHLHGIEDNVQGDRLSRSHLLAEWLRKPHHAFEVLSEPTRQFRCHRIFQPRRDAHTSSRRMIYLWVAVGRMRHGMISLFSIHAALRLLT